MKDGGIESLEKFFPRVAKAYLIGEAAPKLALTLAGKAPSVQCGTMEKAVAQAFKDARAAREPGAVVLLSPACASFDQYKDFEARGAHFKKIVEALDEAVSRKASA